MSWVTFSRPCGTEFGEGNSHTDSKAPASLDGDAGRSFQWLWLEREFDGGLQNTGAADTVDVADAAAEGRGDLTQVRSDRTVGQTKGRRVGHVEGVEAGFQVRLTINREGLGEGEVVRDVRRSAELVAARIAERASNRVGGRVRCAFRRCSKAGRVEPSGSARTVHIMRDLERRDQIARLRGARGRAGAGNVERQARDSLNERRDTPSAQDIGQRTLVEVLVAATRRKVIDDGLREVQLAVEVHHGVVAVPRPREKEQIAILRTGAVAFRLTPGERRVERKTLAEAVNELRLQRLVIGGVADEVLCDRSRLTEG